MAFTSCRCHDRGSNQLPPDKLTHKKSHEKFVRGFLFFENHFHREIEGVKVINSVEVIDELDQKIKKLTDARPSLGQTQEFSKDWFQVEKYMISRRSLRLWLS